MTTLDHANQVADAILELFGSIDGVPPWKSKGFRGGRLVRNLSTGDLQGDVRPLGGLFLNGRTSTLKTFAHAHEYNHRAAFYLELEPRADADEYVWKFIDDLDTVIRSNEKLITTAHPEGLLVRPMFIADVVTVVDLDSDPPVASAELFIDLVYRVTH